MANRLAMYVGLVLKRHSQVNAARIEIQKLEMDTFLKMYFTEKQQHWAADPKEMCKSGDVVLIKELEKPVSDEIGFEVRKVVFPLGQTIDPVSGKRCRGVDFINEEHRTVYPVVKDTSTA